METTELAVIFDALSKSVRIKIFRILLAYHDTGGISPTAIARRLGNMPRNTLSFHLSLLSNAGLCRSRKIGKTILYIPDCKNIKAAGVFLVKDCCKGACKW